MGVIPGTPKLNELKSLLAFCRTKAEKRDVGAIIESNGNITLACCILGVGRRDVNRRLAKVKLRKSVELTLEPELKSHGHSVKMLSDSEFNSIYRPHLEVVS